MRSLADRFWEKVEKTNSCWYWRGAVTGRSGYGHIRAGGRDEPELVAHRVAYELLVGPIPLGLTLDHFRLNPGPRQAPCSRLCVNPSHLEPVTAEENVIRGDGPPARNRRKVKCARGHLFNEQNTWRGIRNGNPIRSCRACHPRALARYKHRKSRALAGEEP